MPNGTSRVSNRLKTAVADGKEVPMNTSTTNETKVTAPTPAVTPSAAKGENAKAPKAKATPKVKSTPKVKAAKAPKEKKPKKETGPKPNRTFAIRITDDELAAIHKAAGPRNATRLVRAVVAAFAAEDEGAFKTIVKEAREARSA
jgi:outer membrane biosynthesis protein TonB